MDKLKKEAPEVPTQEQLVKYGKTINQMRREHGLEPIDGGDKILISLTRK